MSDVKVLQTSTSIQRVSLWSKLWGPVLLAIGLVSRLPFQSQFLYHWDSINFAFALDYFDISQGQPHVPGYLLYVLLGRGIAWITGDAQTGYVFLAILGSALAAVALYDLGQRMWNTRVGWIAALLLLSSPLYWFYGEVALPHALDALVVIVIATLSWRVWYGERHMALLLAFGLGLAGGFRPQTLVFLFPLALVACFRLPFRWKVGAGMLLGGTVLAWLIPLFALSGGMANYFHVLSTYAEHFNKTTSIFEGAGWSGIIHNLDKLFRYTLWGWAFGIIPAILGVWFLRRPLREVVRSWRFWFLLLWAAPGLGYYTLIHMGQQGLIFVYLPILMLVSARAATALIDHWRWGPTLTTVSIVGNSLLFLLAPVYLLPGERLKVLSYATIQEQDALIQAQIEVVREAMPEEAVLIAEAWRFPQYYLPEVPLIPYENIINGDATTLEQIEQAQILAWYEPEIDSLNISPDQTVRSQEHNGVQLRLLERGTGEEFIATSTEFGIAIVGP
jgi:hypothetical protein